MGDPVANIEAVIAKVDDAITLAEAKIVELNEAAESGGDGADSGDDGDDGDQTDDDDDISDDNGRSGPIFRQGRDPNGYNADGATSLTTFATIVVASVYTLAF